MRPLRSKRILAMLATTVVIGTIPLLQAAEPTTASRAVEKARLVAGSMDATSAIATILNRWEPIAVQADAHWASWREVYETQLRLMPEEWLKEFLRLQPRDDLQSAKANYKQFTQVFVSAQANIIDQTVLKSDKVSSKLGSATNDLIFNPIPPCRVADTRNVGGPITAGGTRTIYWWSNIGGNSWAGQGGVPGASNVACPGTVITSQGGTLGNVAPAAAVATITVVNANAAGNFVVWNGVGAAPTVSALNWDHAGEVIANTTLIPGGNPANTFSVAYNGPSGQADVVVDVVGYFVENGATALQCVVTLANDYLFESGFINSLSPPPCPATYSLVSVRCVSDALIPPAPTLVGVDASTCTYQNTTGVAQAFHVSARCCRLPGQ